MYRAEYRYSKNHRHYEIDSQWEALSCYDENRETYSEWGSIADVTTAIAKAEEMMPGVYVYRMIHKPDSITQ